jgi:hypothetical protein
MTPAILLAAIILIPVVVIMVLRINATLVFMSLCLGDVLVQFVSPDSNQFLALFSAHVAKGIDPGNSLIKIVLLALPVVLTAVFMIKTVHGNSRLVLNLLPAAGVGLLGALLLTPLLPSAIEKSIIDSVYWTKLLHSQDIVVGASALACLFVLWLQRPKAGHEKSKHGKH